MKPCAHPGCNARVLRHEFCEHHRTREGGKTKATAESRERYNAKRRLRTLLGGLDDR